MQKKTYYVFFPDSSFFLNTFSGQGAVSRGETENSKTQTLIARCVAVNYCNPETLIAYTSSFVFY